MTDKERHLFPYAQLRGRRITVRDKSGTEFEGVLEEYGWYYITLADGNGDRILISREENNVTSIRVHAD